jgi:hypothetical protein
MRITQLFCTGASSIGNFILSFTLKCKNYSLPNNPINMFENFSGKSPAYPYSRVHSTGTGQACITTVLRLSIYCAQQDLMEVILKLAAKGTSVSMPFP